MMYPHYEDQGGYSYPEDSLVQAFGVVSAATISNPQLSTHVLESVKRSYPEYGIQQADSLELAVLSYGKGYGTLAPSFHPFIVDSVVSVSPRPWPCSTRSAIVRYRYASTRTATEQ